MKFFYSLTDAVSYSKCSSSIIVYKRTYFPVYIDFKGSKKWVVFTPGACKRDKPMPVFQRSSFSSDIDANVISIFDPGLLFHQNLQNSWFSGTPARHYCQYIADIIRIFFQGNGVKNEDVLLWGTSAGGIPAIKIAQNLPGSKVWVGNIQVEAYKHSAFDKMLPVLFPHIPKSECIEQFIDRFDVRLMDGKYTLYYFQNKSDVFHYKHHYASYKNWYESDKREASVSFFEYDDAGSGHGSVGRKKEIEIISALLNEDLLDVEWANKV